MTKGPLDPTFGLEPPPTVEELAAARALAAALDERPGDAFAGAEAAREATADAFVGVSTEASVEARAEALAAARLLRAAAEIPVGNDLSRARLRRALVAAAERPAERRARRGAFVAAVAAAAALLAVGVAVTRRSAPEPTEALLLEREAAARSAVAQVAEVSPLGASAAGSLDAESLLVRLAERRRDGTFASLESSRMARVARGSTTRLLSTSDGAETGPFASATATPGGRS